MEEFRLSIDLYGDENNFGLLTISDNEKFDKLPTKSFPMENATPEAIGKFITEYLKNNCT